MYCNVIFINCKWVFTQWQWFTIRHNKQITHITHNNATIKRNTAHKTTHTIKDTLHRMNTNSHNYNYINFTTKYDHIRDIFRKIMVSPLMAQMRNVNFLKSGCHPSGAYEEVCAMSQHWWLKMHRITRGMKPIFFLFVWVLEIHPVMVLSTTVHPERRRLWDKNRMMTQMHTFHYWQTLPSASGSFCKVLMAS
jgi:hypothetical protein